MSAGDMVDDEVLADGAPTDAQYRETLGKSLAEIHAELNVAARILSDRCLYHSAAFAAELCTQTVDDTSSTAHANGDTPYAVGVGITKKLFTPNTAASAGRRSTRLSATAPILSATELYGKTLFDLRRFDECAHTLRGISTAYSTFLRAYALYMASEQRGDQTRQERRAKTAAPPPNPTAASVAVIGNKSTADDNSNADENNALRLILNELTTSASSAVTPSAVDALSFYVAALIAHSLKQKSDARHYLLRSLHLFPINWSGWQLLAHIIPDHNTLNELSQSSDPIDSLPNHFMRHFFYTHFTLTLPTQPQASLLTHLDTLTAYFPYSTHLLIQTALTHYHLNQFDQALTLFEHIQQQHPYRIEHLDTYSNILFVKEDRAKLSLLAHNLMKRCKYSEETCIVTGNHYALRGDHSHAILYFKRALILNPNYTQAYTLMGHEYIELHNVHAAIHCYQSAIDENDKDYRAWYGLGQTYELLNLPNYSLYYFTHACQLRPYDARMWCAMAECYERCHREEEAIKSWERAESCQSTDELIGAESVARARLAKLYNKRGDLKTAALYYRRIVDRHDELQKSLYARSSDEKEREPNELNNDVNMNTNSQSTPQRAVDPLNTSVTRSTSSDTGASSDQLSQDVIDAFIFLAQYSLTREDFTECENLCHRLMDIGGAVKERAKVILTEMRAARLVVEKTASPPRRGPVGIVYRDRDGSGSGSGASKLLPSQATIRLMGRTMSASSAHSVASSPVTTTATPAADRRRPQQAAFFTPPS